MPQNNPDFSWTKPKKSREKIIQNFFQKTIDKFGKLGNNRDCVQQGTVVQLVRAPPCHGGSCGFEPRQSR